MSKWQSIQAAPKNEVVLTDEGTSIWDGRWYLCTTDGSIPSCADWGREPSEIEPVRWTPLPQPSDDACAETAEAERNDLIEDVKTYQQIAHNIEAERDAMWTPGKRSPDGAHVVVPVEPTPEMRGMGWMALVGLPDSTPQHLQNAWDAMLASLQGEK